MPEEVKRDARSTGASMASNLGLGGVVTALVVNFVPDVPADFVPYIGVGVVSLLGAIGSAARDSQFINADKYEQGTLKDFVMTIAAKLFG